jgi:hypothetical protein
MKRLVVVAAVSVVIAFVVGRMSVQVPASAEAQQEQGGGAATPSGNGDVNGDGRLDIADAIYIINHQFRGGPAPVPYEDPVLLERIVQLEADLAAESSALQACSAELSTVKADLITCQANLGKYGLPATGQTKCYNAAGTEIACDNPNYPGQDGFYQAGFPSEGRFVDNQDGTVTDNYTGLMWQKEMADVSGNGSIGDEDRVNWQNALKYCEALDFAGHADWRLPNVRELRSIVDYGRWDPTIDPVFSALNTGSGEWSTVYWSSTSYAFADVAWLVNFVDCSFPLFNKVSSRNHVRAVRGGL